MKGNMYTILLFLSFTFSLSTTFANSNTTNTVADTSFMVIGEFTEQAIPFDPFAASYFYQFINIENTCGTPFIWSIDILEMDIPEEWIIEYCSFNTINDYFDCGINLHQTYVETDDFINLNFSVLNTGITKTDTAKIVINLFDSNRPEIIETITFVSIIEVGEIPEPDSGFSISSNISDQTQTIYSPFDYVSLENNIEIWNDNESYVDLGWKVINQFNPPAWEFDYYEFYLANQYFPNEDIPTEGTFRLNPNDYSSVSMYTGVINANGTPGTKSVEILIYDLNDSINHNEILTFNANIELGASGSGFELFDTFSETTEQPFNLNDPIHFSHFPISLQSNDLFTDIEIGWFVKTNDMPESWEHQSELLIMSAVDFENISNINENLSGTFTLEAGGYASIEYFLNLDAYAPTADESILEIVLYDTNDSLATAQTITFLSELEIPDVGTGFEVYENYTGSINYLQAGNNDPLSIYNSPLYLSNDSENIIHIGWKKLNETIPSEWDVQYEFNAYQDYFVNAIPESGSLFMNPYEQAYFALNFNEVFANDQAGSANLQILVYDVNDSTNYNEILTFNNSICIENINSNIVELPTQESFCQGEIITLETVDGLQNINWSTGETSASITTTAQSYFYVFAEDANGCPVSQEIFLEINNPYEESVCVVSVDPISGKNVVIWDKTSGAETVSYNIYKETEAANEYALVGTQAFDELSQFVDVVSNPEEGSNRYKISTINSCGSESALSAEHKTMHLTINISTNDNVNLIWDAYEGFEYPTFNILRGSNPLNMQLIAQRPSNTFTFTDIAPPTGDLFYQIEIISAFSCTPMAHSITGTRSNFVDNRMVAANDIVTNHSIKVFPNPFDSSINIGEIPKDVNRLILRDIAGRILKTENLQNTSHVLQTAELANGVYYIELIGEQRYINKVIK